MLFDNMSIYLPICVTSEAQRTVKK